MVNVIIPVFKSKNTIKDTLNSLLVQTKKMFIITIVQDSDGEDYSDIIKFYRGLGLHINLIKTEKNVGPGGARQLGLDKNKMCDYIMFLDSDDILNPRAIEILYSEAKKNFADIVISSFIVEQKNAPGYTMNPTKMNNATWVHGKLYRYNYLKENNIRFLDEIRLNEDSYFNLVAINCTDKKIILEEVTHIWRDNKDSLTRFEKNNGFFLRSYSDFIKAQILGLSKIYEIKQDISDKLVISSVLKIYYTMMKEKILNGKDSSYKKYLKILQEEKFKKYFDKKENWMNIVNDVKIGIVIDKDFYFYEKNFKEWYEDNIDRELKLE